MPDERAASRGHFQSELLQLLHRRRAWIASPFIRERGG